MKHIKLFENFDKNSFTDDFCKEYDITNYTINEDGSIDVDDDVDLSVSDLVQIPIKFGKVSGDFNCSNNHLTTLSGCPSYVGGDFKCRFNRITNLIGSPNYIGGTFICSHNDLLTSLVGSPEYVGGVFDCSSNSLKTLVGLKTEIVGSYYLSPKFDIILAILQGNVEYINNFYDFHIITNLDDKKSTLNLKRLNKFIGLYDLNELTINQEHKLNQNYNLI